MKKYILALDEGTSSARAILFTEKGEIAASAAREFPQYFPGEGLVEHEANEIFAAEIGAASEALMKTGGSWADVISIGITNQRETTVVWERKTGRPISRAIVWQCRRTASECERLMREGYAEMIRLKTGLLPDPYFSATKLKWILDQDPDLRPRAKRGELCFGTVDTWLMFRLSGGKIFATDPSNASRTMLYNITKQDWDDELLRLFDIPREMMPEILPSAGHFGATSPSILGGAIPITGVAGDQQAALFGQGCHTAGAIKNTYGTGGFLLMNTGDTPIFDRNGLLTTVAWQIGSTVSYALEGSVFVSGSAIQWLRDGLGILNHAAESEELAASVEDTGGVYLVPAFAGLGAPYWDPFARGTLIGLTRGTTRAHIARAALEAMAYQAAEVAHLMEAASGKRIERLRVDGGAAANNFLLSFEADLLGIPVVRPACIESTALGAAGLAGIGIGLYRSPNEFAALLSDERIFRPERDAAFRESAMQGWTKAVSRSLGWAK